MSDWLRLESSSRKDFKDRLSSKARAKICPPKIHILSHSHPRNHNALQIKSKNSHKYQTSHSHGMHFSTLSCVPDVQLAL